MFKELCATLFLLCNPLLNGFDFSYDLSNSSGRDPVNAQSYQEHSFNQSTQQAYYFVEDLNKLNSLS